jgi:tetratricopeptide (TPR) repeat protein
MQVIERLVHFSNIIFFLLFLLIPSDYLNAQTYPDNSVHKILKSGIDFIIDQKYDEAEKVFKRLEQTRKDIPLGKIYLAAVSIARSYDYEIPFDNNYISKNLESAKKISERLLEKDEKNIWNKYFYALTQGYLAYYDALRENWLDAFATGLSSVSAFEDCLGSDKNFYEAKIAIGSYKFWKSSKTEFINWLPFVDDEKDLGINYLKEAVKYSGYNSHLAVHSLIWIYIEQEDYKEAVKLSQDALQLHPDSRIFKWGLARSFENVDIKKSISLYKELLESYPNNLISNRVNEVTLKHIIAQLFNKLNNKIEAIKLCDEILSISGYTEYELEKLQNRLQRVRVLKLDITK